MNKKVIGVFHSEEDAIRKVEELEAQGCDVSDIYAVAKDEDDISMVRGRTNIDVRSTGGNWFDRFVGFLTGEEPVREALHNVGLTGPEMDEYYHEIDDGGILLYVDKEYDSMSGSTIRNMDEDPTDVHNVDSEMHTEANFVPHTELDTSHQADRLHNDVETSDEARMKLHEEKLRVDKEEVETGEVRVRKNVVEEEQSVDVPVSREEIYIERRPVDETEAMNEASAAFEDDGQNIRIPLREERVEVTKKPVVNEELIIGKKTVDDTETISETIRREEADIDGADEMYGQVDNQASMDADLKQNQSFENTSQDSKIDVNQPLNETLNGTSSNLMGLHDEEQARMNKLDEELEKRRAEMQAKNYNPYSEENRNDNL
ncbi:stress response protein [Bacillus freudenreichii]|nr:stress response protein [Bacillus freudenreichii]